MKYKTLARIALKLFGVFFLITTLPLVPSSIYHLIDFSMGKSQSKGTSLLSIFNQFGVLAQLLAGLYLFFGGKWILNKIIPSNRPYCPDCGYDLTNLASPICPECGCTLPNELSQRGADAKHQKVSNLK